MKTLGPILVWNRPKELVHLEQAFQEEGLQIITRPDLNFCFVLAFAYSKADLKQIATDLVPNIKSDLPFWIAYPKKSSKKYACDFDRDHGWEAFAGLSFEPVRQIALDEDWSALRFRDIRYIKTMKRNPKMMVSQISKTILKD